MHLVLKKSKNIDTRETDLYSLLAIDSEYQNDYNNSLKYYNKLYSITYDETYLLKILRYSYKSKDYNYMYEISKAAIKEFPKKKAFYQRQNIIALIALGRLKEALVVGDELLSNDKSNENYNIVATIYYALGDYGKSVEYYKKSI